MVRHLAIEAMRRRPPRRDPADWARWVETWVAGHGPDDADAPHRRLSYVPLPTPGPGNPSVSRVLLLAPCGDDDDLERVCQRLAGLTLRPRRGDELDGRPPPRLVPIAANHPCVVPFTAPARNWRSVTPVILPGHADRRDDRTRALIRKALRFSGLDQPCRFEWDPEPPAPPRGRPQGPIRPDHLLGLSAVRLVLRFERPGPVAGPFEATLGDVKLDNIAATPFALYSSKAFCCYALDIQSLPVHA